MMIFSNHKVPVLFSTTVILLFASAKCSVHTTDLAELGKTLLNKIKATEFTDFAAIEDFKRSVEFAMKHTVVATPKEIHEAAVLTNAHTISIHILNGTDIIRRHFNTVFSLLTPYDDYEVRDLEIILNDFDFHTLYESSIAVFERLFSEPQQVRTLVKTYKKLPHEHHCKSTTSIHHKVVALHNRAILNLIMGFSTILYLSKQFHLSPKHKMTDTTELPSTLTTIFNAKMGQTQNTLRDLIKHAPRGIHRCDPSEHEHEETYDGLYDLVEYYVTSERFLNENNQCSATPKNYHGIKHSSEIENYIDNTIRCQGTLYHCNIVNLKHLFLYGEDDIYRRYHSFSVTDLQSPDGEKVYGNIGDATVAFTSDDLNGVGEYSPNYPDFNLTSNEFDRLKKCPIYGCYCDNHDSPRTVRYFSTKLVSSDVKHNRVITGLQLEVQDRVVYIQIQTGKLIGLGVIDSTSVEWEEIKPVDVIGVAEKSPNAEFIKLDYYSRSLYLDDLSIDKGYYLTGVQFTRAYEGVRIAAQFTPYNGFTLVTHVPPATLQASDIDRTERKLDHHKILLDLLNLNSQAISVQNRDYVKFQPSDIENDAGQTTVPFLDIQPVVVHPPTALGGFGIYLKGNPGSGTFVALRLLSAKY